MWRNIAVLIMVWNARRDGCSQTSPSQKAATGCQKPSHDTQCCVVCSHKKWPIPPWQDSYSWLPTRMFCVHLHLYTFSYIFCLHPPTRVCLVFHAVKLNSVFASLDNEPRVLVLRHCLKIRPRLTVVIFYGPMRVCDEWGCSVRRKTCAKITVLSQETYFVDVQDPDLNCSLSLEWPHIG